MNKVIKWVGIIFGGLFGLVVLAIAGVYVNGEMRLNRTYAIQAEPLVLSDDAASLARGRRWSEVHCQSCHGADLGGGAFFSDDALGYVDAPNLTSGKGGIGSGYTDADWVRALRHGIRVDGTSVFIMPSNDFYHLSDADLAGTISYVKSVPPVDRETRQRALSPLAKVLLGAGIFPNLLYAETISHETRPPAPAIGVNADYGNYLARAHGCASCHGASLAGAPSSEPGAPPAPNLTPGGRLAGWSEDHFRVAVRTGRTPDGRQLSEAMPWKGFSKLADDELAALWLYLKSLPANPNSTQ